ncbi:MAG: DUF1667 domain-containing protein [Ruminococcaceae bacterium]|nr:DUF1667 domain-containing protein [Oscillospiraceae bacterium]
MNERILTCIGCPLGCLLTATLENGAVTNVQGNTCKRGDDYARKECTTPERMVTGTIRVRNGSAPVVSVRTSVPVPKHKVMEVAAVMSDTVIDAPIVLGDVVLADIADTGTALIATRNVTEK